MAIDAPLPPKRREAETGQEAIVQHCTDDESETTPCLGFIYRYMPARTAPPRRPGQQATTAHNLGSEQAPASRWLRDQTTDTRVTHARRSSQSNGVGMGRGSLAAAHWTSLIGGESTALS
jgi:hypothetical protein